MSVPVPDMEAPELVDGVSSLSEGGSELYGTSESPSFFDCAFSSSTPVPAS